MESGASLREYYNERAKTHLWKTKKTTSVLTKNVTFSQPMRKCVTFLRVLVSACGGGSQG
ncbi:hypothetical protein U27_05365 [Candidatus Vecturithrix granuli]|uniref:Uncharacterized protein n=1 Tax=Vecturithrix granuli TaxID=1499967 RepID=A0A081C1D6_VECG1|nr:hypothetical protein U27_05365 [Candidatus Vecturithrix granuli]